MNQTTFKTGDLVVVREAYARPRDRGRTYRVTNILKVNITVTPIDGGRALRGKPELFELAPERFEGAVAVATLVPFLAPLSPGEVVTVVGVGWKEPSDRLYVVLNERGDGKVKLARLGGDNGRYWSSVPRAWLTIVDSSLITAVKP